MGRIKNYFLAWDAMRIIRLLLSGALVFAYFENRDNFYLFGAFVLLVQALFNLGCSGGSCGTKNAKGEPPIVKMKQYDTLK